jgi:hypothetical protein
MALSAKGERRQVDGTYCIASASTALIVQDGLATTLLYVKNTHTAPPSKSTIFMLSRGCRALLDSLTFFLDDSFALVVGLVVWTRLEVAAARALRQALPLALVARQIAVARFRSFLPLGSCCHAKQEASSEKH